jgi:hypothetical protein
MSNWSNRPTHDAALRFGNANFLLDEAWVGVTITDLLAMNNFGIKIANTVAAKCWGCRKKIPHFV